MAKVWIVADQEQAATGRFYLAYLRRLLVEARPEGRRPRVKYRAMPRGMFKKPARFCGEVLKSGRVDIARDRLLLVFDSEYEDPAACRRDGARLVRELEKQGFARQRVHVSVVVPMSEALYLLDAACEDALASWVDVRPPKQGRRVSDPAASTRAGVGVRTLAARRRLAVRDEHTPMPSKDDLYDLIGHSVDKTALARRMVAVVEHDGWRSPEHGLYPELDRLRAWLR